MQLNVGMLCMITMAKDSLHFLSDFFPPSFRSTFILLREN